MSGGSWSVSPRSGWTCSTLLILTLSNVNFAAAQEIQFERNLARAMLSTISKQLQENFYDRELRRLNWMEMTEKARVMIENAAVPAEMLGAIYSLVKGLNDSHTIFLPPQRTIQRHFGFDAMGFGDEVHIYAIDEGGAASGAGLQVGDWLSTINGTRVTPQNIQSIMLYSEVLLPVDTMEVAFQRGNNPARSVRVQARISERPALEYVTDLPDVYQLLHRTSSRNTARAQVFSLPEGRIVYLRLPLFSVDDSTLASLIGQTRNARAVIVDLRGNPGGSLQTMQYLGGFFESQSITMAHIVGRKGSTALNIKPRRPQITSPLFILVDSRTASASEIFARHFQLTGRAVVIGDRTAGRASASRIFSNNIGSTLVISYGLQVAIGRVVFPGGEELEGKGVVPDQSCIPTALDLIEHRDVCLTTAVELAVTRKAVVSTNPTRKVLDSPRAFNYTDTKAEPQPDGFLSDSNQCCKSTTMFVSSLRTTNRSRFLVARPDV